MDDLYTKMLLNVGSDITKDDLKNLLFHCKLPARSREDISTAIDLFTVLEEKNKLSIDNLDYLKEILHACNLKSLADYVEHFKEYGTLPESLTNSSTFIDEVILYLSENLEAQTWKFIVRELGVKDTYISQVVAEHQGVREQIYTCLRKWKSNRGSKKCDMIDELNEILRKNGRLDLVNDLKNLDVK